MAKLWRKQFSKLVYKRVGNLFLQKENLNSSSELSSTEIFYRNKDKTFFKDSSSFVS